MSTRPLVNITGTLVALGPVAHEHVPLFHRWDNDWRTTRTTTIPQQPFTLEQYEAGYASIATATSTIGFTLYDAATWQPIGTAGLHHLDERNRTAEFGIGIGEVSHRGRGFGTEATTLVLDYAFTALGLHSVMLRVLDFNVGGLRAYTRAGFREFGRRRQCYMVGGRLWDMVYMDCLASEFASPVLATIFAPAPDAADRL